MLRRLQKRGGARGLARWHPRAASGQVHILGWGRGGADARRRVLPGEGRRGRSPQSPGVWALGLTGVPTWTRLNWPSATRADRRLAAPPRV